MTEEIGSDKHKRPSTAEIDMAVYKDRLKRMDADQQRMEEKMDAALKVLSQIETNLALGNQRFDKIENDAKSLKEDTTARLEAIEADRRSTGAIIGTTINSIAVAVIGWFTFGGK